mmetsp:Transcript_10846/g.27985  ORF Transcript_10846/g.27985 Transcript_10846/m.27985 type:complete len:441 (-) Transcript_10846:126-1448(-)
MAATTMGAARRREGRRRTGALVLLSAGALLGVVVPSTRSPQLALISASRAAVAAVRARIRPQNRRVAKPTSGPTLTGERAGAAPRQAIGSVLSVPPSYLAWLAGLALSAFGLNRLKVWFETPSRPYETDAEENTVGKEYDKWTREGVLEYYWGEHIHMGSYNPLKEQKGYNRKDPFIISFIRASIGHLFGKYKNFKDAKLDFTKEMLQWSGAKAPKKILDVGCGIGGSSRHMASVFPDAEVLGITLSPAQVERATQLAKEQGLTNVKFQVTDALNTGFDANTFDLVWGCESGEHMPDKKKYIEEMTRVLKPGGNLVVATWCEREPQPPFTPEERKTLNFVYEEWAHPYFISIEAYGKLIEGTGVMEQLVTDDWVERTLASWRHSIWVGIWSPWYWIKTSLKNPKAFIGFVRDAYTLERYHRAMNRGLLKYGMMKAVKKTA